MNKRILICASTFPRYKNDQMVDFVWQQARYLKKHYPSFDVHVLVPHAPQAEKHELWEGVHIHRYAYLKPESMQSLAYPAIWPNIKQKPWRAMQVPFLLLASFLATRRIVNQYQIDLIYSHWFMPQGLMSHQVAKAAGIPHAMTSHAADIVIMKKIPWLGNWLVRKILPQFKAISFAGSRGRQQALAFFNPEQQQQLLKISQVLPMGVDLQLPDDNKQVTGKSDDNVLRLLFVGRLAEKKGVEYLLEAMATVKRSGISVHLDLLGDGPLMPKLMAKVKQLKLDAEVNFQGFVNGEEKFRFIQKTDLFVLPSIITDDGDAEGLPVSLLEAMSAGAVCCASDQSGAPDIIDDGKTALLFSAKDADALAQVLKKVNNMDAAQRTELATNAREAGQAYLWDNMIHRHAEHLISPFLTASKHA